MVEWICTCLPPLNPGLIPIFILRRVQFVDSSLHKKKHLPNSTLMRMRASGLSVVLCDVFTLDKLGRFYYYISLIFPQAFYILPNDTQIAPSEASRGQFDRSQYNV